MSEYREIISKQNLKLRFLHEKKKMKDVFTSSFSPKRLSNFFCREKVKVSQPMLELSRPCQK
jgi:hypothetical protein